MNCGQQLSPQLNKLARLPEQVSKIPVECWQELQPSVPQQSAAGAPTHGAAQAAGAGAHGAGPVVSIVADVNENSSKTFGVSSAPEADPSAPQAQNGRHTTSGAASASFLSHPCVILFYSVVLWTVNTSQRGLLRIAMSRKSNDAQIQCSAPTAMPTLKRPVVRLQREIRILRFHAI
jgi:hypothetical protein